MFELFLYRIKYITRDLENKYEDFREMIYEALEYLETRPPRYMIWHVFPIDINLVTGLIELCTTYIIILLQFRY
ncbi:uncharacterized protein LOC126781893 [Nymphalis io]|uniref:uncharacterized protein LOC126781893 n=1 Tax=Inachis io TaxID=171585 RepID=UPI00216AA19B|nr:uncharacterized protein LOC126781893 [Nymphalis io]